MDIATKLPDISMSVKNTQAISPKRVITKDASVSLKKPEKQNVQISDTAERNIQLIDTEKRNIQTSDKIMKNIQPSDTATTRQIKETDNAVLKETNVQGQKPEDSQEDDRYNRIMAEKAVENANTRVHEYGTTAKFDYNDKMNRITITIMDRKNNEIIKEVPPEQTQKMLERIHAMTGIFLDTEI